MFGWSRRGRAGGIGTVVVVFIAAHVLPSGTLHASVDPEVPERPEDIVSHLISSDAASDREEDALAREALRQRAEACAPIIARHLRMPRDLEEWDPGAEPAVGEPLSPAVSAVFNHNLLQELGREHADPILKEFFTGNRRLLEQAARQLDEVIRGAEPDEEVLVRLHAAQRYFSRLMTRAIRVAVEMGTPVLVEPVLSFYEAGLEHHYTHWADYALIHAPQQEDVLPRLRAVKEDPQTPESMKLEIGRALERYAASLASRVSPGAPALSSRRAVFCVSG